MTGAEAFLVDGQRAPHQGLGLGKPVRGLKQRRQIVQVRWPHWDDRGRSFLVDGQRAAHQRLGLRKTVRGLKQPRQIVRGLATGMTGAEAFFGDGQRAAVKRLGLGVIRARPEVLRVFN